VTFALAQTCFDCGGAAHPASGWCMSPTVIYCGRCARELARWYAGTTQRTTGKKRRDGSLRVGTARTFYEAAGLKVTPVAP
jgi:hypothetical protein